MSSTLSWYIGVVTLANILACVWLIWWTMKPRADESAKGEVMGHVWDGDLQEYNNPLPRWWLYLFYITIVFGLLYLLLYPGLGAFKGLLGWSSRGQYEQEIQTAKAKYDPLFEQYAQQPIPALIANPDALRIGQRLFVTYCASCHGSDAGGAKGFPNLRDDDWLWGGSPDAIQTTILNGRIAAGGAGMPAVSSLGLTETDVDNLVAYVLSLSGRPADPQKVTAGKEKFAVCAGCHGPDGKGNQALGAPNLTDKIWLYGGSPQTIRETLVHGRKGQMPAFKDFLGEAKVHLLAAYVYSLSHQP
jgi:cytochrome c oxidase cbb3-type subunit 3